MKKEVKLYKT